MDKPLLDQEQIKAISNGSHGDPFSVLGLNIAYPDGNKAIVIRAFIPWAQSISIVFDHEQYEVEMGQIADEGLFEFVFEDRKEPFDYYFVVRPYDGESYKWIDPYSFGSLLSDFDLQLWGEGNHYRSYEFMGAHRREAHGIEGTHFVVPAPSAGRVSVIGSFNNWDGRVFPMRKFHDQGLWEIFIPGIKNGDLYKYEIKSHTQEAPLKKSDPYAFLSEKRPGTASVVYDWEPYEWGDNDWMEARKERQRYNQPISVYEVHLGSWNRKEDNEFLTYREMAEELVSYVADLGYTHIELMPVAEHPYDPSWGYQVTGFYAPTSRFGKPDDFMYFIDQCHQHGIGVLVDWVPGHFAKDENGLRRFDGTALFEHEDPRQGEHQDWGTNIFNYGRIEVKNFLFSNAIYWADKFHIDGLRVDAVASMLYLDYSREDGDWVPNRYGGNENLEAIDFLKKFNEIIHDAYPGILTLAEESTSWPKVSHPTYDGGLGFDYKWNMGWMNDTLTYMQKDPIYRKYHQGQLTFSLIYAFSESFILPLSHDEVVHMKQSLISKMPGDDWQKFANMRLLYTYMYGHPGKKLLFMGGEFAQWEEWTESKALDWELLEYDRHKAMHQLVSDLNHMLKDEASLHRIDDSWEGFQWIDMTDEANSIIAFARFAEDRSDHLIFILNFTPTVHRGYKFGVPEEGEYQEILNSDAAKYSGSNVINEEIRAVSGEWHGQPAHVEVNIPPMAGMVLKPKQSS